MVAMMSLLHLLVIFANVWRRLLMPVESFQSVSIISRQTRYINQSISYRLFAEEQKSSRELPERKHPARSKKRRSIKNPHEVETWRVYGVDVSPDSLEPNRQEKTNKNVHPEKSYMTTPVIKSLLSRLRIKKDSGDDSVLPPEMIDARVIRRSIDARRRRGSDPKYTYVVDVDITKRNAREFRFVHQPGRMERMSYNSSAKADVKTGNDSTNRGSLPKVVIVGAGPGEEINHNIFFS
jgi:hypothetical protein